MTINYERWRLYLYVGRETNVLDFYWLAATKGMCLYIHSGQIKELFPISSLRSSQTCLSQMLPSSIMCFGIIQGTCACVRVYCYLFVHYNWPTRRAVETEPSQY